MKHFDVLTLANFKLWLDHQNISRKISLIQQHHTWEPSYDDWSKKPDGNFWMNSMENYQVSERGFAQIAQNFTTFPDGSIGIGRPLDIAPAGIKGANANGICIEHLGKFDLGGDTMSPAQSHTIINMNAYLIDKFKLQVNTNSIVFHHWYDLDTGKRTNGTGNVKTCPGTNFFGGNTVESCEKNFLPLINKALS
jgi:hypothetical protein